MLLSETAKNDQSYIFLLAAPDPRKELAKALSFVSSNIGPHNRIRRTNKVSDFIVSNEGGNFNIDPIQD